MEHGSQHGVIAGEGWLLDQGRWLRKSRRALALLDLHLLHLVLLLDYSYYNFLSDFASEQVGQVFFRDFNFGLVSFSKN